MRDAVLTVITQDSAEGASIDLCFLVSFPLFQVLMRTKEGSRHTARLCVYSYDFVLCYRQRALSFCNVSLLANLHDYVMSSYSNLNTTLSNTHRSYFQLAMCLRTRSVLAIDNFVHHNSSLPGDLFLQCYFYSPFYFCTSFLFYSFSITSVLY